LCHTKSMVIRKSKKREDVNEMAYSIARAMSRESEAEKEAMREKNLAAVALGSLGDLKGGKARAQKLSTDERKDISNRAALKRWLRQ
jgi:hypothetical protein